MGRLASSGDSGNPPSGQSASNEEPVFLMSQSSGPPRPPTYWHNGPMWATSLALPTYLEWLAALPRFVYGRELR